MPVLVSSVYKREQFYDGSLTADRLVPHEHAAMEKDCLEDFKETIVTRTVTTERITALGQKNSRGLQLSSDQG